MSANISTTARGTASMHALRSGAGSGNPLLRLPRTPSSKTKRLGERTRLRIYITGSCAHQHFLQPMDMPARQVGASE